MTYIETSMAASGAPSLKFVEPSVRLSWSSNEKTDSEAAGGSDGSAAIAGLVRRHHPGLYRIIRHFGWSSLLDRLNLSDCLNGHHFTRSGIGSWGMVHRTVLRYVLRLGTLPERQYADYVRFIKLAQTVRYRSAFANDPWLMSLYGTAQSKGTQIWTLKPNVAIGRFARNWWEFNPLESGAVGADDHGWSLIVQRKCDAEHFWLGEDIGNWISAFPRHPLFDLEFRCFSRAGRRYDEACQSTDRLAHARDLGFIQQI